jgi:glycosyltransferase involved in cell wall biosynthesis
MIPDQKSVVAFPCAPLVTIAIPTFNRASLLKACVTSALAQTYPNFEVLVSDNASTDPTPEVLREFSDGRLRIVRQPENIGLLPNWNACLAEAKGRYIVFLSDDDRIAPWFLHRCARVLEADLDLPIVVALSNIHLAATGRTLPAETSRRLQTGVHRGTDILAEFLSGAITVTMCSVLIHTALLKERGGIPLDLPHTADIASWAPLLFDGRAGLVNEACATYCAHNKSETARLSVERLLADVWKMVDLLSATADRQIVDASVRQQIRRESQRCFARRGLIVLSDYRRSGGALSDIAAFLWRNRQHMGHVDATAALRFLALVLSPNAIIERLRRRRGTIPDMAP